MFYKMPESDKSIKFIIGERGYGKSYFEINKLLLQLRFNVNSIGFEYWITAIKQYRKNYYKYDNSIERIYRDVALYYNTTRNKVERSMRTARATATQDIQEKFNYYGKITNKSVLELLTHHYRILFDDINKHIPRID